MAAEPADAMVTEEDRRQKHSPGRGCNLGPDTRTPDPLTTRELEVLRLMAGGYSNREISEALGIAEGTVKNHASSVLSKLGVRDRTRAVLKALELGYLGG